MNEQIKKLAIKSGIQFDELRGTTANCGAAELASFAEALVTACAERLVQEGERYDGLGGREISAQTMDTAAELIKTTFGIT